MEKYFDTSYIFEAIPKLLPFLGVTFLVTILSISFGSIIGFILAVWKLSENRVLKKIAYGYTTGLRCTPSIVLLFLVYYGIPAISKPFEVDMSNIHKIIFIVITFSLQFAASISEAIRTSHEAIDRGQYEAAVSVGLSNFEAYRNIIVPQALVVAIPNVGNSILALIKEGALAYTIGLIDVMGQANLIISNNYNTHALETFIALSLIYWSISIVIEKGFNIVEKNLNRGKARISET